MTAPEWWPDPDELLGALHAQHGGQYRRAENNSDGAVRSFLVQRANRGGALIAGRAISGGAVAGGAFGAAIEAAAEAERRAVEATVRTGLEGIEEIERAGRLAQHDFMRAD